LYEAEALIRPNQCTNPKCKHAIKPHIHSSKKNLIKDIRAEGKLVLINLNIHRYRCPDCNYVFPDEFNFYEKDEHITKRLKQEFVKRSIKGETFRYIANDYSVDGKTVAKAFNEYADTHRDEAVLTYTPVVLGIDEAHIDDHYRLILTDIINRKLLDIKKNNHKITVNAYLRTLDKDIIKCATMDFATGYAYSVNLIFPKVIIVIDKFHVIQLINRSVGKVRIALQNFFKKEGYNIRMFKSSNKLFMTNWEDLTPNGMDKLNELFNEFPQLYEAYMVKETFRDIYATAKTHSEALVMFDDWLKSIPDYDEFITMKATFLERRDHITNYWHYGWTNAFTESTNNSIKKIEKAGRGYKFDVLRDRCILSINNPAPDKFDFKKAVYVKKGEELLFKKKQENLYSFSFIEHLKPKFPIPEELIGFNNLIVVTPEQDKMLDYIQRVGRKNRSND
jgi:transposase